MLITNVIKEGPLFEKGIISKLSGNALNKTMNWGIGRIRGRTPVVTGRLKAGWYNSTSNKSLNFEISNPVFYAPFVERRRGMISKTLPEIESKLLEETLKETNKLK
ncbi:hypothetical protein Nos7524_3201 [Nostoc sp. PCC 7524]|uniref:HK97 gp10 family phage protein n=1 Tax=Nostoc sp. (strain ATCC 29411 / PCC 7524) TaxID=28072 RepID=UPI00029EF173|nr:HK97 gp10 family phage protein [Nostoc sp. PCC 7524]AFY49001.1 hypothetical protein Nos7524_3201 [Nostoc sp. PCC 7524]